MRILLESSRVPIYERINYSIKSALEKFGHEVIFFSADFPDDQQYLDAVNNISADLYFLSNEGARAQKYSEFYGQYLFELLNHKLIFLCHDNMFCGTESVEKLKNRYEALRSVSNKSRIFCIESSNIKDLNSLGVENVYKISHATEFKSQEVVNRKLPISFVGHTMAGLSSFPVELFKEAPLLINIAKMKLSDCEFSVQQEIDAHLEKLDLKKNFVNRQYLLNILNKMTFSYRGDLLNSLNHELVIYGGDLSYGKGDPRQYIIPSEKIGYLPATNDYRETENIYRESKININISGFQFDTAITNRVLDVIAAGGLLFTDYKSDFLKEFPFAADLVYKNTDDLKNKIENTKDDFYLKKINEICSELKDIVHKNFNYENTINQMLDTL